MSRGNFVWVSSSAVIKLCTLIVIMMVILNHTNLIIANEDTKSLPQFVFSSNIHQKEITEGKRQYQLIQESSENPRYGDCWKKAVLNLHSGCKHLTEIIQSRLAIQFASCFLQQSGHRSINCSDRQDIKDCLANIDSNTFSSYLQFFTHTQSICLFLQSQVWQENTDKTITKLSESSNSAAEKIDEANRNQNEILKLQYQSLSRQQKLLEYGESLGNVLESSKSQVSEILQEFKSATNEQRLMVLEVFDRVSKLQALVVGEFAGFYTLVFFSLAIIISYLLTSTPRTNNARFWLFAIIILNACFERLIAIYCMEEEAAHPTLLSPDGPIYQRVWLCRKVASTLCVLVLAWQAYRYKDYNVLNNRLLVQIHEQNLQLKLHLEQIGVTSSIRNNVPEMLVCDKQMNPLRSGDENTLENLANGSIPENEVDNIISVKVPKNRKKQQRRDSTSSQDSVYRRYNLRSRSSTPVLSVQEGVRSSQRLLNCTNLENMHIHVEHEASTKAYVHGSFFSSDDEV